MDASPPLLPKKVAAAAALAATKASASGKQLPRSQKKKSPGEAHDVVDADNANAEAFTLGKRKRSQTHTASEAAQRMAASHNKSIEELHKKSKHEHDALLKHASGCLDLNCPSANCAKMKALLRHRAICKTRATGGCPTCRRIWELLQIHARQCRVPSHKKCPVLHCADLKNHFKREVENREKTKLLHNLVEGCKKYFDGCAKGAGIPPSVLKGAILRSWKIKTYYKVD